MQQNCLFKKVEYNLLWHNASKQCEMFNLYICFN